MICAIDLASPSGGSAVMPVVSGEVVDQRAVEAVEDDEVVFVRRPVAKASAAAEHLLEQDPRLDRPQQDQELEIRDVDAGREQVDRDDDAGLRPVAELADPLQRPVDSAGDLGDEGVAATEDLARLIDELVGVRDMRKVVGSEDQGLGEPAVLGLVLVGVTLQLLQDAAVGVWGRDVTLDRGGVKGTLVLEQVELQRAGLGVDLVDLLACTAGRCR